MTTREGTFDSGLSRAQVSQEVEDEEMSALIARKANHDGLIGRSCRLSATRLITHQNDAFLAE